MPTLEDLHHPDTVIYRDGKPCRAIDLLMHNLEEHPQQRSPEVSRRKTEERSKPYTKLYKCPKRYNLSVRMRAVG